MKTKIFAAFGCLGKTTFANKHPELALDIESSPYEYIYDGDIRDIEKLKGTTGRKKNPDFPRNYIEVIKQNLGKYPFIFIVQAKSVMKALEDEGICYSIIYPSENKIPQILADAQARGNGEGFIERLRNILSTDADLLELKNTLKYDELILFDKDEYITTYFEAKYPELLKEDFTDPDIKSSFVYHGEEFYVDFYGLYGKKIPQRQWKQVYIVGNYNGKIPVVKYEKSRDNLPGGGVKFGESIDEAIQRELKEELNMTATSWRPLGYQRVYKDGVGEEFQLRVYAELCKLGEFECDPDGHVIGYELVSIEELESHIGYGEVGEYFEKVLKGEYGKRA